jgi:uncharacterized protein with HEPN domain
MRQDERRLEDFLDAIGRIESKIDLDDESAFRADELLQVWVVHHLQIIGEASRKLSDDLKEQHPGILWTKIVGMRHYLVHEYFGVDLDTTWRVIDEELDELRDKVQSIRDALDDS